MKKETKISWYLKCLSAFLLTYAAFFAKFPHYVLHPNNQTFFPNGDLLVTLSDMIYHVRYDKDGTFSGMNYPDGEYIFMTDANGSFATVFRWIDTYLFSIDQVLPGLLLSIIFLLIGMCGMFLFMILRTSGIKTWLAMILAPLITLLSPQMVRIACHLSLSFPFVIPMIMLWLLRKYRVPKIETWDAVFVLVTFFFFMNNAYIGFIMCMLAGVTGFVLWVLDRKQKQHRTAAYIMMVTPVLITVLVYIILKVNDPYSDRLEEQWGFFHYHTRLYSLFYPKYSFVASLFDKYANGDKRSIEWTNNLGVIPMLLMLSYGIYSLIRMKIKSMPRLIENDIMMKSFLISTFLMFLFAANTAIFPIKNLIESYMGPLLMFKSSGRFSWPLYFVVALFAAKILQGWVRLLKPKPNYWIALLIIPVLGFYAFETNFYLDQRFTGKEKENYLTAPNSDKIAKVLEDNEINTDNYQAMFVLPLFVGWNEKIRAGVYNRSERGALTVSTLTGIPMINGRLSRNSTSKTLEAVQVSSHPLIKKEVLDKLPNSKPILLIQGTNIKDRLSVGERALRDLGTEVFRVERYIGYRLEVADVEAYRNKLIDEAERVEAEQIDSVSSSLVRLDYEDSPTAHSLFGSGGLLLKKGKQKIIDFRSSFVEGDSLRFTAWTEVTSEKYGMPDFVVTVKGPDKFYKRHVFPARVHKNVYKNWIRSEKVFAVSPGENWIEVICRVNQDIWLDEAHLDKTGTPVTHNIKEGILLSNIPVIR